ncbi:MAG: site-2 protease family protein [Candidatus Methanomethylophilaceae archaeon]|nr:site-2 protease family protein [Candidatus Methanomethylophilaceae archaeon]
MSTAYLVLLILLAIYVPVYIWVWRNPEAAERLHLVKYGPALMIKTHLGIRLMGRLGRFQRFWRAFGFFSKVTSAVLLFLMMYMVIVALINLPATIGNRSMGIEYALAIPGFNPILPLSYGIVALVFAMVVHEMAHGIQSRANGIDVDSTGLLYGVVPLGAFVEPNEAQLQAAPRRPRVDVYAAGITTNTIFAVIAILLLSFSCANISSPYGDSPGVYSIDDDSPALASGVPIAALITGAAVEGSQDYRQVRAAMWGNSASMVFADTGAGFDPTLRYVLEYEYKGSTLVSEPVQMGPFIKSVVKGSPAESSGAVYGEFIYSITMGGEETLIGSVYDFMSYMSGTSPGDAIILSTVKVGEDRTPVYHEETILVSQNGKGFLGLVVTTGGFTMTTPEALMSTASSPFAAADGSPMSYVQSFFSYLSGPFNGMSPVPDNVKWWYDAPLGDLTWVLLSLLYWIFWLDILLAISNALPAYPFDGGLLFAGWVDWVLEKTKGGDPEKRQELGGRISSAISNVVLLMFVMLIVALII